MAACACARQCIEVIEPRTDKSDCGEVAGFARVVGHNVILGHRGCDDPHSLGVASGTIAGRSLKHTADMACAALDTHVRPGQRKAGFVMVEILPGRLPACIENIGRNLQREQGKQECPNR